MSEKKENFILGCVCFTIAVFSACVLPFVLKHFDIYYLITLDFYKKIILFFSLISMLFFMATDNYHSKTIMVVFLGILLTISLHFLPL